MGRNGSGGGMTGEVSHWLLIVGYQPAGSVVESLITDYFQPIIVPGNRFLGNCIRGVGKRWGSLTFIHAPLSTVEVIRRVGKSSRTDD